VSKYIKQGVDQLRSVGRPPQVGLPPDPYPGDEDEDPYDEVSAEMFTAGLPAWGASPYDKQGGRDPRAGARPKMAWGSSPYDKEGMPPSATAGLPIPNQAAAPRQNWDATPTFDGGFGKPAAPAGSMTGAQPDPDLGKLLPPGADDFADQPADFLKPKTPALPAWGSSPYDKRGTAAPAGPAAEYRKTPDPYPESGEAAPAADDEMLGSLFKKTHGGGFDPNSRVDREKMDVIRGMIDKDKGLLKLSPTQFAMRVYGRR